MPVQVAMKFFSSSVPSYVPQEGRKSFRSKINKNMMTISRYIYQIRSLNNMTASVYKNFALNVFKPIQVCAF